jgi:hypothetical protein
MVAIRLHRLGVEALLDAPPKVGVQRISAETAAETTGGGPIRIHRLGIEVLAQFPAKVGVQRVSAETAALTTGGGELRLHALAIEVLLSNIPAIAMHRISTETAALTTGGGALRAHRLGLEVLARTGVPAPTPLTLAADIEFWMHNWADTLEIETSYSTDVIRSPETGAEERRSLIQRPVRTLTARWTQMSQERVHQLRLMLRRLPNDNVQLPLYCDATELTASASAVDTQFFLDADNRRFFVGGRVLFFEHTKSFVSRTEAKTGIITELTAASITVDVAPGVSMTAGHWAVVPLIDCELVLEPSVTWETAEVANVEITFREHRGPNALPPITVGLPPGFPRRLGRPIFEIEPNWIRGIDTSYPRYGSEQQVGRRLVPLTEGTRYNQLQTWDLAPIERPDWYRIASMFDSRRGRAETFWAIDREFILTVSNTTSIFVDIVPFGRFEDFDDIWTESNLGVAIKMKDGQIHLMQVNTVADNGSFWRLTAAGGQSIADPIVLADIDFCARARISRFNSDSMRETWHTNNVCDIRLQTIETQDEQSIDFDA